jgi:hypothetical protein
MYRFPSKDMPAYAEAIRVSGGKPMRLRLPRLAFACGLALLTYGCGSVDVINCLPADPGLQLPAGSNIDPAPPAFVDLYLDASTSMLGFLPEEVNATPHQVSKQKQPRMEAQITYETVLDAIRRFTQESSPDHSKDRRVFAFGGSVCDITTQDYGLWLKSAFYKSSPSRNCDNALSSRTELGRVLEKVKTEQLSFSESPKEGHLSVIVTDLFFERGLGIAAISQVLSPIDAMLKSGLAFAVLGLRVPFNNLLDINPPVRNVPPWFYGYLPVYVLVVGQPERIRFFFSKLEPSLKSEWKGAGYNPQMVQFHMFMRDRFQPRALTGPLIADDDRELPKARTPWVNGSAQSFELPASTKSVDLLQAGQGSPDLVPAPAGPGGTQVSGTWPTAMQVKARSWYFGDDTSQECRARWTGFAGKEPLKGEMATDKGLQKLNAVHISGFDSPLIISDVTYLTNVEMIARMDSHLPAWWKQDWSIEPEKVQPANLEAKQFPTVNLESVLKALEQFALKSAGGSSSEQSVGKANIAFRKGD